MPQGKGIRSLPSTVNALTFMAESPAAPNPASVFSSIVFEHRPNRHENNLGLPGSPVLFFDNLSRSIANQYG